MSRRLPTLLLALALGLPVLPWPGGPRPPGLDGLATLRTWWLARLVEDASIQGHESTLQQSRAYSRLTGNAEPLLFAVYRFGHNLSAETRGLEQARALELSESARLTLEEAISWLPQPREAIELHEFLVARRILPLAGPERALAVSRMPELLAAGGPGEAHPAAYLAYLELPASERKARILEHLRLLGP